MKETISIAVFCGNFTSQPLVFAHLADLAPTGGFNPDYVEVICRTNPIPRLRHYFEEETAFQIEDELGLCDTCVLILPEAIPGDLGKSDLLKSLGTFVGHRHVAGSA